MMFCAEDIDTDVVKKLIRVKSLGEKRCGCCKNWDDMIKS